MSLTGKASSKISSADDSAPLSTAGRVFQASRHGEIQFATYSRETAENEFDKGDMTMMKLTVTKAIAVQYQQQLKPPMRHVRCEQAGSLNIKDYISPVEKQFATRPHRQNLDIRRWVN
jgi:hypothetical protein